MVNFFAGSEKTQQKNKRSNSAAEFTGEELCTYNLIWKSNLQTNAKTIIGVVFECYYLRANFFILID